MNTNKNRIFKIVGKLLKRLTSISYQYQGEIYEAATFDNKDSDARIALMGFIRCELIATYFDYNNLLELNNNPTIKLNKIKKSLGEVDIPNNILENILIEHLRRNFPIHIYSLLESGNRFFFKEGSFKQYLTKFDADLVSAYQILRHIRNSMHSNGYFLPNDKKDYYCYYRDYNVDYKYGDFVRTNLKFLYLVISDNLKLYKLMALDSLEKNPEIVLINDNFKIENFNK